MFIEKNSIQIDGVNFGQYLVEVEYSYNKLWASDSGRNLAGKMTGTLVGIFPKFVLHFRKLTKAELETISSILDKATQSFRYYDPKKKAYTTISTYTGDWSVSNKHLISNSRKNDGFSVSFIARSKRT
jgi:hypothetical protein